MLSYRKTHALQLILALTIALGGCANRAQIEKRNIADLYRDALGAATSFELASETTQMGALAPSPLVTNTETEFTSESDDPASATAGQHVVSIPAVELSLSDVQFLDAPLDQTMDDGAVRGASVQELLPPAEQDEVRISEFFEQTDIREAIELLASMTGDKVIIDDTVGGVVTLEVKDVTFEEALRAVLMPLGYFYSKRDGTYVVAPPDPDAPLYRFISTREQFSAQSHLPSKLAELLPDRFRDFYQFSDERNLMVIDAPQEITRELLARLQELDQPVQQVVLEAIVCVTAPDSGFRFGMDWNHVLALDSTDQVNVGLSGLSFSAAASPYGLDNAFSDFAVTSAFVKLLSQEGYVTIRAQPRVTAKDGEKASISIARETFFSLQPTSSNVLFRQDVQRVDAGISLDITPHIRGDIVSVEIERAEVSEDIRSNSSNPELNANPYPIINRRLVSTKVDVRDGNTIVIGGLVQRQTVDRINRIPILGSLPGLGPFFRTVEKQEQDAEVAIFISPRIVPFN